MHYVRITTSAATLRLRHRQLDIAATDRQQHVDEESVPAGYASGCGGNRRHPHRQDRSEASRPHTEREQIVGQLAITYLG